MRNNRIIYRYIRGHMKNIPNIISTARILLIPFLLYEIVYGSMTIAAAILFISGVTDMMDGYIARHFDAISDLGKILDPIADKLTQATLCVALCIRFDEYIVFFILLILKECLMLIFSGYLVKRKIKLQGAKWCGKLGTIFFYATMFLLIAFPTINPQIMFTLLTITVGMAYLAGILYIPDFINYLKEDKKKEQ